MAVVRIPEENSTLTGPREIAERLGRIGIDYETWRPTRPVTPDASPEEVLAAYAVEIESLKTRGGYIAADVIAVTPSTPGLEGMLEKFRREHWHDEDEVRFILSGRGVFHIRPREGPVVAIEVGEADLIRVPRGTWHWFDLCAEREIGAIRLFHDPAGWVPRYTGSGAEAGYEPLCLGPTSLPPVRLPRS